MKLYLTRTACLLLSLVLTACAHKNQAANQPPLAPPVDDVPLSKPDTAAKDQLPPPVVTPAQPAQPTTTASTQDQPKPAPKRKKPVPKPVSSAPSQASNSSPSTTAPSQPAPANPPPTLQAANGTPDETSAIGKLSSGEPADLRTETVSSLNGTEHGLNTLNRKLNDQEEKTSSQIREYIKQARAALTSNDLDGAHILATKAKLLLNELTQ